MNNYIHNLIEQGEHVRQDFKFEISDARKIAKTLSAFSNTEGGRLLVGVKDNGKIAGVRSEEEIYMIEAAAKLYCQPAVTCQMTTHCIEGRTVLEVFVPPGDQRPYYAIDENNSRRAYLRIHDENILANPRTPENMATRKTSARCIHPLFPPRTMATRLPFHPPRHLH